MSNPTLTVSEAEQEFGLKSHTIRRWIRDKKVQATKVGDTYQMDRDSFTGHLAAPKGAIIDAGEHSVSTLEVSANMRQEGEIIAPCSDGVSAPGDGEEGSEATVTPIPLSADVLTQVLEKSATEPQPANVPRPAASPVQTDGVVTESIAARGPKRPCTQTTSKPPGTIAKGPRGQRRMPERKVLGRNAHRKLKKFKKGPVRYAKDAMRQFDVVQMRDVRDWLVRRLDVKSELV